MGANEFYQTAVAKTAEEAFRRLGDEDRYENGHSYSGGIGMKGGFVLVELPKGITASEFRRACMSIWHPQFVGCDDYDCYNCRRGTCELGLVKYTSRKAEHVKWRQSAWGAEETRIYKKIAKNPAALALVKKYADEANDKWGSAIGVEVTGAPAKVAIDNFLRYRTKYVNGKQVPLPRPRGLKVWHFFGMAPS